MLLLSDARKRWENGLYNLIVSAQGWGTRQGKIAAGRVLEYTSDLLTHRFKPNDILSIEAVRQHPTLLLEETKPRATQPQFARIGTLTRIDEISGFYNLGYVIDQDVPPISNQDLESLADDLGISSVEFTRTHWAIKDADLFRVLLRHRETNRFVPRVFQLPARPVVQDLVGAMMPFGAQFVQVHATLTRAVEQANMRLSRVDDLWKNDTIIQDVVDLIATSRVVICDLSGKNANVLYETGIAHTLGKDVILITQNMDDVPFDLRHYRVITYHDNDEGRRGLAEAVAARLSTLTSDS